jgi:hypothetical protein
VRRRIEFSGRSRQRRIVHPDGREEIVTVETRRLHIQLRVNRELTLSSNGVVLVKLRNSIGQLVSIEVEGPLLLPIVDEPDELHALYVEEPLVRRSVPNSGRVVSTRKVIEDSVRRVVGSDRFILNSGDEIYGVIDEVAGAVRFRARGNGRRRPIVDRRDVSAVCFGRPKISKRQLVAGKFALIDLVQDTTCTFGGVEQSFWIRSAIKQATNTGLVTRHPLLGEVIVRWDMIRRVTPLFEGSYQLIDAGPRHLGNGYRESFNRVEPDGTELSLKFQLKNEQLTMPTFLSADIAELIPSGAGTLKATPFLDEARAGFLVTQVFLNEELAGTLNVLIGVRSPASDPERVRLRLPSHLLKAGENSIQIRQTAAKNDAKSFDDCELRAIAIEIEHSI